MRERLSAETVGAAAVGVAESCECDRGVDAAERTSTMALSALSSDDLVVMMAWI